MIYKNTRKERDKMVMSGKEAQKRLEKQYKRQNEHIKNNYDRISITLPKGTKERIHKTGESINGYITALVLADLERRERKPVTNRNGSAEAEDIFYKYGKKYVLSGLGQKELAEKYGEETAKKVIEYAMRQT